MNNVSIVIPTFNRAKMVSRAITSSLAQTTHCEVIVCDHGSTDETAEVVQKFENDIIYIKRERDFGPHFCWLEGILNANYEWIHLQFDDDWLEPTYVEECSKFFADDVGFVFSSANVIFPDHPEKNEVLFQDRFGESGIYQTKKFHKHLSKNLISPGAVIFRKQDMIDALYQGALPLSKHRYHGVGPDFFFTLSCMLKYPKFGFVKEALTNFLAHEQSITISSHESKEKRHALDRAYLEVRQYYQALKLIQKWKKIKTVLTYQ